MLFQESIFNTLLNYLRLTYNLLTVILEFFSAFLSSLRKLISNEICFLTLFSSIFDLLSPFSCVKRRCISLVETSSWRCKRTLENGLLSSGILLICVKGDAATRVSHRDDEGLLITFQKYKKISTEILRVIFCFHERDIWSLCQKSQKYESSILHSSGLLICG